MHLAARPFSEAADGLVYLEYQRTYIAEVCFYRMPSEIFTESPAHLRLMSLDRVLQFSELLYPPGDIERDSGIEESLLIEHGLVYEFFIPGDLCHRRISFQSCRDVKVRRNYTKK